MKIINYIYAAIKEIFALLVVLACYFINLEKRNPKIVKSNSQQPILLIHGLYHSSSAWIKFLDQFKIADTGPVFTLNLGDPFGSISHHAKTVKNKIAEIQSITGRKEIMLVGHSMGGLVAAKFALDLATEDTFVTNIVTIGSPLKGTKVANYLGWGQSVKEMRHDSHYIKDLNQKILQQTNIHFFHIASETDLLIPLRSALFSENVRAQHLILSNSSHLSLLFEKKVIHAVIDYYKKSNPRFLTQPHKS